MKLKLHIILFSCLIFVCNSSKLIAQKSTVITAAYAKKQALTNAEWQDWQHKDITEDSIAGISLDKAYKLLENKEGNTVLVAVLDTRFINGNKDLEGIIWTNKNEIPNNKIDDDKNGYVDDIHGWNFLGNRNGTQEYRANFEFVRIVKKYAPLFKDKDRNAVKDTTNFDLYKKAQKTLKEEKDIIYENLSYLDSITDLKNLYEKEIKTRFPNTSINTTSLDSLSKIEKDSILVNKIGFLLRYKKDEKWYKNRYQREQRYLNIYLSLDYNERKVIGDNVNDINDTNYGNPNIFSDSTAMSHKHSTRVLGVLAANRTNKLGLRGVTNQIKVMLLGTSPSGDEQDKDIALGIRYAVDNGAKIINITFTKYFSLHSDWVREAIRYASNNNVLIVCSAGNYSKNIDNETQFPNDIDEKGNEFVNNLLMIGSSTPFANEYLVSDYSNYGRNNVDVFAPGEFIYTSTGKNKYNFASGTSYSAPIISGLAALIISHYPNLSASEVKQIIMKSGITFDITVNKPSTSKEKELVPFSSLSKSGKIANAYNALLMAEEVSKKKKRK